MIKLIRNLKQALNHGLVLKKVHRVIKFNQNAWLKPYIDMNRDLRKKEKNVFFKLVNNAVFEKTGKCEKHRDIKLFTTERRGRTKLKKPVHLGLSILALTKILMYELWCDYPRPKYGEKEKLCYMDTDGFIAYIKTDDIDDIYKDTAKYVETRFHSSNYELDRLLPKGKNNNVIGLIKDELGREIMIKFAGLRAKTDSYLIDGGSKDEKPQKAQKSVS